MKKAEPEEKTERRHLRPRQMLIIVLPVLGASAVLWLAAGFYCSRIALGATTLPVRLSDATLTQKMTEATRQYKLRIADPAGKMQAFSLQDAGLVPDTATALGNLRREQRSWSARLVWWRPLRTDLVVPASATALNDFISKHVTTVLQPAHDATLTIKDGEAQIAGDSAGKQYGLDNAPKTILAHANQLQTTPLHVHVVALQPAITRQALAGAQTQLQKILHQKITVMAAGHAVTPTPGDIAGWLTLTPQADKKTVAIQASADKVQSFLRWVAAQNSRPPRAQLSGGSATIPGEYGVAVATSQEAADTLTKQLPAAQGIQVSLPSTRQPFKTVSAPVSSSKWIEVDLTTKRMYAYQQANLTRSFLVSAGAPATPTVVGTFAIYSKFTSQNMYGAGADGSSYFQPNVPWINYFYRDYAIHGNYWRPASYFGNINSSHGCVGVNDTDAAWIYKWAPIGTPVVVHK